jgi:hypothetical protein
LRLRASQLLSARDGLAATLLALQRPRGVIVSPNEKPWSNRVVKRRWARYLNALSEWKPLVTIRLQDVFLSGAQLNEVILLGVHSLGSCFDGAELNRAELDRAELRDAYLNGAILRDSSLNRAVLIGAYLNGANLDRAELIGAFLNEAELNRAELNRAELYQAKMYGAFVYGAGMYGACVHGSSVDHTVGTPNGWETMIYKSIYRDSIDSDLQNRVRQKWALAHRRQSDRAEAWRTDDRMR